MKDLLSSLKNSLQVVSGPGRYALGLGLALHLSACDPPPEEQVDCEKRHQQVDAIVNPCPDGQPWKGYHHAKSTKAFRLANNNIEEVRPDCSASIGYFDAIYDDFGQTVIDPRPGVGFATSKPSSHKLGGISCRIFVDGEINCSKADPIDEDVGIPESYPIPPPTYVDPDGMSYYEIISSFTSSCTPEIIAGSDATLPKQQPPSP